MSVCCVAVVRNECRDHLSYLGGSESLLEKECYCHLMHFFFF